ncbi:hypothetical protein FF38_08348 [Lucilia cuprina]|uniref:Ribosomal RNA-processing protein 40 n=1 Tax=Lucilia cuprina TaxID=7375 RepID=A0A0L0CPX6_LUCCU|nr:hypothetical protein FF38_08348 [Lucilia cuprina]
MFVIPGDKLLPAKQYGPGIENGTALVMGKVLSTKNTTYLENNFASYTAYKNDLVIGTITQRSGDVYRVNLQNYCPTVRLSQLAFENATKKNKPNLNVGDVVYGKVVHVHRDQESEIECFDSKTGKSQGMGQLKGGNIITVRTGFARHLLYNQHPEIEKLGSQVAFEMAIGVNGRIWINSKDLKTVLLNVFADICDDISKSVSDINNVTSIEVVPPKPADIAENMHRSQYKAAARVANESAEAFLAKTPDQDSANAAESQGGIIIILVAITVVLLSYFFV